jgi:hypothetical protein
MNGAQTSLFAQLERVAGSVSGPPASIGTTEVVPCYKAMEDWSSLEATHGRFSSTGRRIDKARRTLENRRFSFHHWKAFL